MDTSLITLADNISTHGWVVAFFGVGFVATLVCSLVCEIVGRSVKEIVKLCGAFGIFLIALNVNNFQFYFFSTFIGGLVVASEDFMLVFASIMKAEKKDIAKIVEIYREIKATVPKDPGSPVKENIEGIISEPTTKPPNIPSKL